MAIKCSKCECLAFARVLFVKTGRKRYLCGAHYRLVIANASSYFKDNDGTMRVIFNPEELRPTYSDDGGEH